MENAITYKDLYLSFGEVISMNRLEIVQSPDKHGTLSLSAVLNGEGEGEVFDELPEEVSVLYMENGEEKVLFKGMVASSSMERVGNHRKLELKAYDATYLLDKQRKTRSFQDTTRTNHSVIEEIMKEYPECICMKNLPEKPIDRIWFQYEETDWEFLRRFLSSYSDSLYADATYQTARFQAGLSPEDIEVDWDDAPYRMGKNMERYDFLSQNGFDELGIDKFIEYFVDSYGIYTLGSRLIYKGRRWYVGELKRGLADGLLTTTYRLEQREGLLKPQEYNHRITGISLDGKTVEVQGDTVRVAMNGDMTTEQGTYWFPFSTVASSPDGSGWYSMPEVGDSIRVYFPTCDEKEGYVITKHDSHMPASGGASGGDSGKKSAGARKTGGNSGVTDNHSSGGSGESGGGSGDGGDSGSGGGFGDGGGSESGGGGGGASAAGGSAAAENAAAPDQKDEKKADPEKENPMDDPSKRNIFTQDGCVVQMVPAGVILTAGKSTLMLKKTGEIVMDAPTGISVYAGEKMTMTARKITVKAKSFMEIKNESGADIAIRRQQIKMHGQEIYEN